MQQQQEIRVGSAILMFPEMEAYIAKSWSERKPGKVSASKAFNEVAQEIRNLHKKLNVQLSTVRKSDGVIEARDINSLKLLERLIHHLDTAPASRERVEGDKMLDEGKSPVHGALLNSHLFADYMASKGNRATAH